MLRRRRKQQEDAGIDLTPMLDIVFIMLIFFIVTTSFIKETGIEVNRPNAATAVRDERGNILIAITANDEIWICLLYTSPSPRDATLSRMPSSA